MLKAVGYASTAELMAAAVPESILNGPGGAAPLRLPEAADEVGALAELRALADRNQVLTSMIGLGYYDTLTPPVILRNILENPAWYTAYTPYQPEISQGRLEALLNFQTVVADLTGLPVSGASLLDESTAAGEAMTLARRATKSAGSTFIVDSDVFPQTLAVLRTRAEPLGIDVVVADLSEGLPEGDAFGVLVQYPAAGGAVRDPSAIIEAAHERGATAVVAADILALTCCAAPASSAPTSPSAPPSASACRWASAARTPATCRCARACSASCRAGSSAFRWTTRAGPPTGSPCRPASSTSGGRRPPATSAPPRCCSR